MLAAPGARAAELVVIVSARNPVTSLRADQVADIFLGEAMRFPDGAEVLALDQALNPPLRNEFYQKVASRTPALMKAYWTKRIFTGRGQPPRELSSSVAVRKAARSLGVQTDAAKFLVPRNAPKMPACAW